MMCGRCPCGLIRGVVDATVRAASTADAIGHAERPRLTHPGNPANAGRQGRRPLRVSAERRYPHHEKLMHNAANLRPPLGSPERGAVAALCAVTEGLVQGRCDVIKLSVNQGRAGVEALPYGVPALQLRCRLSGGRGGCGVYSVLGASASVYSVSGGVLSSLRRPKRARKVQIMSTITAAMTATARAPCTV